MAITRWNVMTGLAGMYLIRDADEDGLRVPHGDHEVPLIICDRNLDTDDEGNLTGQLLHKERGIRNFKDATNFYINYDGWKQWEQWAILNASPVSHPMRIHLVHNAGLGTRTPLTPQGHYPWIPMSKAGRTRSGSMAASWSASRDSSAERPGSTCATATSSRMRTKA
jgi:FtsP/CotA-like multicopper oxidase with cupredoxin domain